MLWSDRESRSCVRELAGDLGDLCISFESWLYDFIGIYRIEGVAFEAPIMGNRGGGIIMPKDAIRMLEKAGALIAAEIDRLERRIIDGLL